MSVVANISFVNNYNSLFMLKATVINTSTLTADELSTNQLIANEAVINTLAAGNITTSNITNADTLTTYFENSQYTTVEQVLNVTGVANIPELGGSNATFTSIATQKGYISSITTNNINLDGNLLDTAGAGIGAVLLLNGYPVTTTSTSISTVANWSVFPAISTVYMNSNNIVQGGTIATHIINADNTYTYDLQAANQIVFGTNLYGGSAYLSNVSAIKVQANLVSTLNLETNSAKIQTLVNSNVTTDTINATNITAANYQTTALGSYNGTTGNFTTGNIPNLNVTNSANFSGTRPNFTTGINSSGANNFNNQSLDNCPNINTQGTTSMTIASANGMDLTAPTRIQLVCDGGNDIGSYKPVNIIGKNGNRGQVNITAEPGYINVGSQIQGEVNITANGGGGLTAYATGGNINITANTGSSPVLGTLSYSAIKIAAASVLSYAGFASPLVGVPGYNYIQGTLGINLVAGTVSVIPNVPGTVYLYGATGIPQQTGGVRCQNGIGVDFIVPYPTGFIGPEKDLFISGNPAGNKVTLSNVRTLQSDGGVALGFTSMSTSNFQASNIIVMKGAPAGTGIILGLTGQEELLNFSNVSTLGIQTGLIQANNISSLNASVRSLNNISTINGFTIDQLVSTVTPPQFYSTTSTFNQLFTSSLQANNISSITANITQISGLSTLNGYTVEQLISSVSPLVYFSTVSSFQQLATSSFRVSSIIGTASNLNFLVSSLQLNGTPLSQALQLSTTQQLYTSSLAANNISSGVLQVSSINGYNLSQLANQPLVSSFSLISASSIGTQDFFASTGTINVASNVVLNVSSINGYNTKDFLALTNVSTVSSFNNLYANNLSAGQVVAQTLSSQIVNASSINGYTVAQFLAVPLVSTVSTFSQVFTSSLQAVNVSSIIANIYSLNGVSSIDGYSISQLVSSVSPPTPAPSSFTQLYTSSLVVNGIRGSNYDLNVTSQSIVTVSAGNRLNLNADTCNIAITAPNIQTLTSYDQTVGVGHDYALTATNNISMNSSNTAILYTTNTAPTPPSQGIVILGQGNSIFASQIDTTVSAVGTLNLNGASVRVNGVPLVTNTVTSTFTQLYTYQLSNNPTVGSGQMGILAATQIDMAAPVIQTSATQDYLLFASNTYTQSSNTRLQGSNAIAIYNGALPTVAAGGITVQATNTLNLNGASVLVNGQPVITTVTSTFTQLYTYQLSNNPTVGSGQMGILAATELAMAAPTIQVNAAQDYLLFASNTYTQSSNTRLQGSNTIAIYNGTVPTVAAGDITVQATNNLNLNGASVLVNGAPIGATSTFQQLYTSSLGATLNYLSLTANRSITQNTLSTITNARGAWFSGDITATTFNGLPLPTGGGGSVTSSFQNLYTNTLSNNPVYGNDLNINATVAIHMGNSGGLTSLSIGDSFDVMGTTGATNIYSAGFTSLNDTISLTGRSNITFTSPSTLTSNLFVADIFNNPAVGVDINLTASGTINNQALNIVRNANNTITETAVGGYSMNTGAGLATGFSMLDNITLTTPSTIVTADLNVQTINGQVPNFTSSWVGSATSDLNMNSYKIYGCNAGNSLGNYQPFKFIYEPPTAAGQSAEFAIQAHPQDAGVVFNLRYGVDMAGGYGYLLCEWPGYIVVPMKIFGQDIALEGGETVHINANSGNVTLHATGTVVVDAPSIDMCNNYIQHINYLSFNNNARISENVANLDIVDSGTGSIGVTATSSITLTAGSNLNILSPLLNFSNETNIGGQLKIDADAQLTYATQASGYGIGSNAPIPLIQCGTISLTISENNTLIGGDYAIPIPYDDTSYCLQLTYKTNPPYAPDAGIVWSGQAAASNLFEISAIGSNVGTGVTLNWYWTTIGKYPKGVPV